MARKEGQTPPLQFLSQPRPPAWVQIVDPVPDQGALDLTAQLSLQGDTACTSFDAQFVTAHVTTTCEWRRPPREEQNAGAV